MSVKMIVTDLDRTLLRSDKSISDYTTDILNRCHDTGIKIIFATARLVWMTNEYCRKSWPDAVIAVNGAAVYSGGELLCEQLIDTETSRPLISDLVTSGLVLRMSAQSSDKYYTSDISVSTAKKYPQNAVLTDFMHDELLPFRIISVHTGDKERMLTLTGKYSGIRVYPVHGEDLIDIMPAASSKLNAVKYAAEYFRVGLGSVVAFGDDFNDLEMLECCGKGVAVENAIPAAKAAAGYCCEPNDDDGVASWITENILCE